MFVLARGLYQHQATGVFCWVEGCPHHQKESKWREGDVLVRIVRGCATFCEGKEEEREGRGRARNDEPEAVAREGGRARMQQKTERGKARRYRNSDLKADLPETRKSMISTSPWETAVSKGVATSPQA